MTYTIRRWLFAGIVVAQSLGAQGLYAQTLAETEAVQGRVQLEMERFVQDEMAAYFRGLGQPMPRNIGTQVHIALGNVSGQVKVVELNLAVTLTTDQPAELIRESRQNLARKLVDRGYRLERIDGIEDARPLAKLTVATADFPLEMLQANSSGEYAIFAAIILGLLASLVLLGALITAPWRKRRKPQIYHVASREPLAVTDHLPEISLHFEKQTEETMPSPGDDDIRDDPQLFASALDPETAALRQLPFEKILDLLVAADTPTRRDLMQRLELNPLLRRRLEQELMI